MRRAMLLGALGLGLGCYGGVSLEGQTAGDPDEGASESGDSDADADQGDAAACEPGQVPPLLRRLTASEVVASVRDLLGVDISDLSDRFPVDATVHGFSNNARVQSMLLDHTRAYQDVAEIIAERLLGDVALRDARVGCTPGPGADDACLREFLERLTRGAFRRPTDAGQIDALAELAASADDPWAGVGLALRAVLQSPRFLFRIERGQPDPEEPGRLRLDGYELATRLSYFLWQTTPDPWLLDRAADGTLDDGDGIADVARQMIDDPRATEALTGFAEGWLRLAMLDDLGRDPSLYPQWSPALRDSMRAEIAAMITDAARGEGTLLHVYDGRRAWVDDSLAELYDLPTPGSDQLTPVDLPEDDDRGGLLGTSAVLALTTPNHVTSPVRRGMFVWESLLCSPLPPPPPGVVGELPPPQELPKQDALELHRSDPSCAGCHDMLDPLGAGLERYDALGQRRALDEGGQPVIEQGHVPGVNDSEFGGAGQLGAQLAQMPEAHRCLATQVLRWSMGRSETREDDCLLDVLQAYVAEGDFAGLVETLVRSEEFRYRPVDEP